MSIFSKIGSAVSNAASKIGSYVSNVASNPSIYTVVPGSKGTWLGESIDSAGKAFSPNAWSNGAKSLLESLSGEQAERQYQQSREDAWAQFEEQMDYTKNQYQYMAKDMAAAGLNPLSSLGATPGSSPSGSVASPTASSSGSGLGAIASFISPILGAVVSRANNADSNQAQRDIAASRLESSEDIAEKSNASREKVAAASNESSERIASAGNESREKIAASSGESSERIASESRKQNQPVVDAQARNLNASAGQTERANKYSDTTGITTLTPSGPAAVRDSVDMAKSVVNADIPGKFENIQAERKVWLSFFGDENGLKIDGKRSGTFAMNYMAWIFAQRTGKFVGSFTEYIAIKFPKLMRAHIASQGN